jgi:hypothetical protein
MSRQTTRKPSIDPGSLLVDGGWLSWLGRHLDELSKAIRRELGRSADDGDLLIALGSASESLTARALRDSGVDLDALAGLVERLRVEPNNADLRGKAEAVRQEKENALDAGDTATADRLRNRERGLTQESRRTHLDALAEIHRRLGVSDPPRDRST